MPSRPNNSNSGSSTNRIINKEENIYLVEQSPDFHQEATDDSPQDSDSSVKRNDELEAKREMNREAARRSRLKRKKNFDQLKATNEALESHIKFLLGQNTLLREELRDSQEKVKNLETKCVYLSNLTTSPMLVNSSSITGAVGPIANNRNANMINNVYHHHLNDSQFRNTDVTNGSNQNLFSAQIYANNCHNLVNNNQGAISTSNNQFDNGNYQNYMNISSLGAAMIHRAMPPHVGSSKTNCNGNTTNIPEILEDGMEFFGQRHLISNNNNNPTSYDNNNNSATSNTNSNVNVVNDSSISNSKNNSNSSNKGNVYISKPVGITGSNNFSSSLAEVDLLKGFMKSGAFSAFSKMNNLTFPSHNSSSTQESVQSNLVSDVSNSKNNSFLRE